jgi:multidrug efflux system outer membrane protein
VPRFSVGPSFTLPLFNTGRVRAEVRAAEARAEAAMQQYQQVVLGAFRDVSEGLVAYGKRREARVQQEALTTAARGATELAGLRYRGGVSPYLEVLDSERQFFDTELGLVRIQRDELLAIVRIYKALGGGWSDQEAGR